MRVKSIFARIIALHVIAIIIVSALLPLALHWLLSRETKVLHNQVMLEQAELIASHLILRAAGSWTLDLPRSLQDLYSNAYGRYLYSIVDENEKVLFSTLASPFFLAAPVRLI